MLRKRVAMWFSVGPVSRTVIVLPTVSRWFAGTFFKYARTMTSWVSGSQMSARTVLSSSKTSAHTARSGTVVVH